ncbi:hypothetical protein PVAND_009819 [Polypedilum vanderplanki]|uniref:Uncharacterized protein n=1 Tax=Polypedilum vanderplanki TaxID=319348 RepID=A0A9J6CFA7_POLVA|nr:hypothetical protein PVAND_009819 [Polypedilum vanderplanki]
MAKFNTKTKIWEAEKIPYPYSMDVYLGEIILKNCDETPDRVIQIHHEENSFLNCQLLKESSIKIAQNLIGIGIKEDDIIGVISRNSNYVTCFLTGSILMGGIIHPLDHSLSTENIRQLYAHTRPKLIICDPEVISSVQDALKDINLSPLIYIVTKNSNKLNGMPSAYELLRETDKNNKFMPLKFKKPADEKLLAILCSSGIGGLQKGVCISHASCLSFIINDKHKNKTPAKPLSFSSIYWSRGFLLNIYASFYPNDVRIWSRDDFNVDKLVEIIRDRQITEISLAPSSLAAILESDFFIESDHESCRKFIVLGSMFSASLRQKFRKTFPEKTLLTGYGLTEQFISLSKPNECYNGITVGSLITPNLQLKIVNEKGESVNPGERGEIRVKPQFKFLGYYNDPEATKNVLDEDGFIKTGDIGYFDDEGGLYIVDRIKEVFKYKNYAVFPAEIEDVLHQIDGIELACVIPIFCDKLGTDLATAYVKKAGNATELTENYIMNYISAELPLLKQLHGGVYFVNDLPLTPDGKVHKSAVKQLIMK